jgi:hypothetical protein
LADSLLDPTMRQLLQDEGDGSSTHPIGWVCSAQCQDGKDCIGDCSTV